ncbi:MAG: DNA cytosine methyltransferase [Bacteroidales bacterium]|jgi:DNA (cytosine-5)-methyltransferase 3A|nr:DNA cytosine methyltransferase [Bacteroidales bacterium]
MNVLSLFDGMSCGQIALKEQGISVKNYYASEIDKYAIKVTQHNFPDTIQLGCVTKINISELKPIDLLIGGSPCTDLSIAGSMKGMSTTENKEITTLEQYLKLKHKGVKFHGQSYLFWEYVRVLRDIQKYNLDVLFLLENVAMKKKWERLISETLGLFPVKINSALVSAQNRNRLYWTNIKTKKVGLFGEIHSDIPQPEDRGLVLKDILEEKVNEKYYLKDDVILNLLKHKQRQMARGWNFGIDPKTKDEKMNALRVKGTGMYDLVYEDMKQIGYISNTNSQANRVYSAKGKTVSLQANTGGGGGKTGLYLIIPEATQKGYIEVNPGQLFDFPTSKTRSGRLMDKKLNTLLAKKPEFYQFTKEHRIRRLTPLEAKRAQTVPDWYDMSVVSETQQYKMLGNGWTVDVIKHIFSFINIKNKNHEKNKLKS